MTKVFIDAGADVVAIHGPHQLRGIEIYKGKPILYSLGNLFLQTETIDPEPNDGARLVFVLLSRFFAWKDARWFGNFVRMLWETGRNSEIRRVVGWMLDGWPKLRKLWFGISG